MKNWRLWLAASRPKTLGASLVPVMAGTSLVYGYGYQLNYLIFILTFLCTILIQIGTNFLNDAIDFTKGADGGDRLGPLRITQTGVVSARRVKSVGFMFLFFALLTGAPLVQHGGWPIFIIGALSLIFGYAYTGGPYPLAYNGLGEVFVVIFFGIVAVMGVYYLQVGEWTLPAFALGVQVGLLCQVLIAINNLRDRVGDTKAGKRTVAVRWGENFVRQEIAVTVGLVFFMQLFWLFQGFVLAFSLVFLLAPFAHRLVKSIFSTPPSPIYNSYLARSGLLHLAFGFLISLGLII